jgi:carbamoyltransferase
MANRVFNLSKGAAHEMIILGFYPLYPRFHDANVCLLKDGEVLFACEEERLLRSQHAYSGPGDPVRGIFGALSKYKIHPAQVDCWAGCGFLHDHVKPWEHFFARTGLLKFVANPKISWVRHHQAHVASSVLTSPFAECLYVSLDGGGDDGYAKIGVFDGNQFRDIHTSQNYHIANFYSFITQGIGFNEFDEGKTMGLASYGKVDESVYRKFRNVISIAPDGLSVQFNVNAFTRSFAFAFEKYDWHNFRIHKVARPSYQIPSIPELQFVNKADIAATLQKLTEDLALEIVANALKATGQRMLCLAGGLFHNVKLNQKIRELPGVEAVHLPMAVGDPGLSLGAALFVYWSTTKKRCAQTPLSRFVGPDYSDDEIENILNAYGIAHERVASPARRAATCLAEGKIVGWFQGKGEYGPRALGNRSVLADPRDLNSKARVNQMLKKRDCAKLALHGHGLRRCSRKTLAHSRRGARRWHVPAADCEQGLVAVVSRIDFRILQAHERSPGVEHQLQSAWRGDGGHAAKRHRAFAARRRRCVDYRKLRSVQAARRAPRAGGAHCFRGRAFEVS